MRSLVGIDPGGTIGVAYISPGGLITTYSFPHEQVLEVFNLVHEVDPDKIVVERYVGGGFRNKDEALTTEQAGAFYWHFKWYGWDVDYPISQRRKSQLDVAEKLTPTKHERDALAHLLVILTPQEREYTFRKEHHDPESDVDDPGQ